MPYVGVGIQQHSASLRSQRMLRAYAALTGGILVSLFVMGMGKLQSDRGVPLPRQETVEEIQDQIGQVLMEAIKGDNIKANLRALTKEPHQAGTKANDRVAKTIENLYLSAGLQRVHTLTYDVLLSYPDWDKPNTVSINNRFGSAVFTSKGVSDAILPDEQGAPHAGHQWLAYSAPGKVEGDIVYCNSGTPKDFEEIKKMGIDVTGKIAMMRYGEGFRGDKVAEAQQNGAKAAILFSDPAESVWMPPQGVQRGSIMKLNGDVLTPLYPAKPGAYKSRTIDEAKEKGVIPSIPALPISYDTAYEILSRMNGRPVPPEWQGNVNVTYRMGPGLRDGHKTTVDVKSSLTTKHVHNVVGYIPGQDEEDRYVILGNHFDAWVYGSIDPNSGTSILAEVARAMVETMNTTTWRPSRTMVFAAWDAEEYGLLGSTEYVEEFVQQLGGRAVAYLNMDCFAGNSSLDIRTIPSLRDLAVDVAKRIPNHLEEQVHLGRKTLYDTWVRAFPGANDQPDMKIPGGGSDHTGFLTFAGVPVIDFNMVNTTRNSYPLYHSLFETPFLNEHLYDKPDFAMHRAIGRYWAELARTLSDSPVLPINVTKIAVEMKDVYVLELRKALNSLPANPNLMEAKQQVDYLEKGAQKFLTRAQYFAEHAGRVQVEIAENPFDQRKLRGVNERIMMAERCFINPRGMPGAPENRHVLYSISEKDSYSGKIMAAVYDAIDEYSASTDKKKAGRRVAEQISIIYHSVHCATNTLKHFF
ncbi:hypothetical protein PFISCL1PPCAC_150 [Pristionchus fissidentatus]|uniref:Peptidase n=1 Tax=Pristionchus fissidentatus TaxID=1538716 RepID=A0AAV5UQ93_9BILA|nr:hypothetical protein PFISCL1PPCAC_150 [Pristionchus fissidentatus]